MANYYSPTVVQETIPNGDMTPLENLLLSRIFESEPDGQGTYFFTSEGPSDMIFVEADELRHALDASPADMDNTAYALVSGFLADNPDLQDSDECEIEAGDDLWSSILQDIVTRSSTLNSVRVIAAFTCERMRPDGFGGSVTLITPTEIRSTSTDEILAQWEKELGLRQQPSGPAP